MTQAKQAEPPSWLQPPLFMLGQDHEGHWVVEDRERMRGGLFVDRDAALRYIRSENGNRPQGVVMVSDGLELDMRNPRASLHRDAASAPAARRRIA